MSALPHVVVVTWFHDAQVGYLDFAYRLRALGRHYRLTILSRRQLPEPELQLPGTKVVVLKPPGTGTAQLVRYWWRTWWWLRRHRADCVLHLGSHSAAVAGVPVGAPQAVYWNDDPAHYLAAPRAPRRWVTTWLRSLQYRGARSATMVMPIGEGQHADLLAQGCRAERTQLIPMGVSPIFEAQRIDDDLATPRRAAHDAPLRVIYTGSVHPDRGRDVMIEALALARRAGCSVHLTLVGADAQQAHACEQLAATLDVAAHLVVLPRLPGDRIPALLREADFGLCLMVDSPYYRVNPPTKLFEYFVSGLPVLASRIASHTAYVADGDNGLLFDYAPESLVMTFERALRERARWPALRRQALASGQAHRWAAIEPKFLAAVRSLHS